MRRAGTITRVLPVALTVALAAGIPATAAAAPAGGTTAKRTRAVTPPPKRGVKPPTFEAKLFQCRRSPRTESRAATVGAAMRPIPGSRRLALRVELYQRPLGPGGRWALRSDVPGLGEWTSPSDPSVGTRAADVFRYRQAVGRLTVPYSFRFRVAFRWSDAAGKVLREEALNTAPCKEPDLRPDLVLTRVAAEPLVPGQVNARYVVTLKNAGRTAALSAQVAATFSAPLRTVRRLEPGASADLVFWGPPCTVDGIGPSFVADPSNLIDEAREVNNSLAATCPATLDRP